MLGVRRQALRLAATVAGLLALAAVAGCGPDEGDGSGADGPEQTELLGPRPGKLTCADWTKGTEAERRGTIEQLTELAGANANPADPSSKRTLEDDQAYDALDGTCEERLARGFLLYEVYNRAAAFDLSG